DSGGGSLTVYSSLPLQGASRPQSEDVIKGIKLALEQKGDKCGDVAINYKSLDDATAAAGKWEAGQTSANAREVAQDDSGIVYIGQLNFRDAALSPTRASSARVRRGARSLSTTRRASCRSARPTPRSA